MNLELTGKVALITGSSRGLGLASARALAAEGCRVCLCARGEQALREAAEDLSRTAGEHAVLAIAADLATAAGIEQVFAGLLSRFGGIDILVNNLGLGRGAGILDTPDAEWQEAFDSDAVPGRSCAAGWPCRRCDSGEAARSS